MNVIPRTNWYIFRYSEKKTSTFKRFNFRFVSGIFVYIFVCELCMYVYYVLKFLY